MRRSVQLVTAPASGALIVLLLLWGAGCGVQQRGVSDAQASLAGPWLITVHPPVAVGIGSLRTVLFFEPDGRGGFEAHSPSGAVGKLAGRLRGMLASLFGGRAYARGALVHIYDGVVSRAGDSLAVSGQFVTANYGTFQLEGILTAGRLSGALSHPESGEVFALVEGERHSGTLPLEDYAALVPAVRTSVETRFYNPRTLGEPRWARFWSEAEHRLGRARDDLEAIAQFGLAASSLGISHFRIKRADVAPELTSGEEPVTAPQSITFEVRPDSVAVLSVRRFLLEYDAPAVIRAAFAEVVDHAPRALIVDLRQCAGGDFSSTLVAAHLLEEPAAAGFFLSGRWWAEHEAAPSHSELDGFPRLSELDVDAFYRALRENGVLVGHVEPQKPAYRGPVFVLTSQWTASAAEPLAYLLQATGRATLLGQPTAGAMLSPETFPFGDGWELVIPTAEYFTADGTRLEGCGVTPDVPVEPDQALDAVIELLRTKR